MRGAFYFPFFVDATMGVKAVKQYLHTHYIVSVQNGILCFGTPMDTNRIRYCLKSRQLQYSPELLRFDDLETKRLIQVITANFDMLDELYLLQDDYQNLVTIYTYQGDQILQMQCEQPCWPNVTTCGDIIYDNTHNTDRNKVVEWAIENAQAGIELNESMIKTRCEEISELTKRRHTYRRILQNLNKERDRVSNQS